MRRNLLPLKSIRSNSENSFHHRSLPDGSHKTKTTTVSIRMKMEWLRGRKVIMKIQKFGHLQDVVLHRRHMQWERLVHSTYSDVKIKRSGPAIVSLTNEGWMWIHVMLMVGAFLLLQKHLPKARLSAHSVLMLSSVPFREQTIAAYSRTDGKNSLA